MRRIYILPLAFFLMATTSTVVLADDAEGTEVRESWEEENGFFPRRRVVAPQLKSGDVHGEARAFDAAGRLILTQTFDRGQPQGKRTLYYPGGKKFEEATYVNGRAHGPMTKWYEDGSTWSVTDFVRGVPHGKAVLCFPGGIKMVEGEVANGVAHGNRTHYLPDGRVLAHTEWIDGREVKRNTVSDCGYSDFQAIQAVGQRSGTLKDYWRNVAPTPVQPQAGKRFK